MRSKWMRYSSSSASRSPFCARSTSARTSDCATPDGLGDSVCAIDGPCPSGSGPNPLLGREPDAAVAGEPLHVDDPVEPEQVAPVFSIERERRLAGVGERPLQR